MGTFGSASRRTHGRAVLAREPAPTTTAALPRVQVLKPLYTASMRYTVSSRLAQPMAVVVGALCLALLHEPEGVDLAAAYLRLRGGCFASAQWYGGALDQRFNFAGRKSWMLGK